MEIECRDCFAVEMKLRQEKLVLECNKRIWRERERERERKSDHMNEVEEEDDDLEELRSTRF